MCCHTRAHPFALSVTVMRYSGRQLNRLLVVSMIGRTSPKCTRLKDRDYDVTPRIILILSLTCTPKCTRGRRRFARCSVDIVGEECEVYCEGGRRRVRGGENVDCSAECDTECTMVTSGGDI